LSIWKKALSAALSAALIASLTASAAFAVVGGVGDADQTNMLDCTAAAAIPVASVGVCSQVADGISTVTLSGDASSPAPGGFSTYISAAGAVIISAGGQFTLGGGIVTAIDGADINDSTDSLVLRAPAVPGTATVSVYSINTGTGIATLEGTMAVTFTATSGLAVSEANSVVKIIAYDATPTAAECTAAAAVTTGAASLVNNATLCITVNNINGSPVNAPMVAVTITPVGLVNGAQSASAAASAVGFIAFQIQGSTLAGVAAIAISVTVGTTTTSIAPRTFTFTGPLASLTVTQVKFAVAQNVAVGAAYVIANVVGKDAAGNALACDTAWTATSGTTTIIANANLDVVVTGALCEVQIIGAPVPATLGSTAITVKNAAATISAAPFTMYVSGVTATVVVAFSATTINPGGSATLTLTAKDAGLRPVADGTAALLIVSAGAITPVTVTTNGMATATYLAPFNTGVVTALGTVGGITASGSTTVGPVVPVVPVTGTNASALGVSHTATYSTATKVAALNTYQTFKISFGATAAGSTVGILVATKSAAGVWSSFTRLTGRVADATGTAWFSWRNSAASWISVRGDLAGNLSNAVQARWR